MSLSNSAACSSAVRKPAISLADSTDLRYDTTRYMHLVDFSRPRTFRVTFVKELKSIDLLFFLTSHFFSHHHVPLRAP